VERDQHHQSGRRLRFHGWKCTTRADIGLEDLELVKDQIGSGQYGAIKLVSVKAKGKAAKEVFALKVINRERFRSTRQEQMVLNEKRILEFLDHPFHLRLINTYKTPTKLYLLTEYVPGGDLFDLVENGMTKRDRSGDLDQTALPSEARKFYFANVLLALKHLHDLGIIHRDIKSSNLLLGANGYVKVCDFGLARFLPPGQTTRTLVGTYQYLAPEQCRLDFYDHSVDIWALGITLFEMAFGYTPFDVPATDDTADYSKTIINKILTKNIHFPSHPEIGLSAKLFLKSILTKDKKRRLGGQHDYDAVCVALPPRARARVLTRSLTDHAISLAT
jgi:serine/threonine protein kinase